MSKKSEELEIMAKAEKAETLMQEQLLEKIKNNKELINSVIKKVDIETALSNGYLENFEKENNKNITNPTLLVETGYNLKLVNSKKEILLDLDITKLFDREIEQFLYKVSKINTKILKSSQEKTEDYKLKKDKLYSNLLLELQYIITNKEKEVKAINEELEKENYEIALEEKLEDLKTQYKNATTTAEKEEIKEEIKKMKTSMLRTFVNFFNNLEVGFGKAANKFL